MAGGSWGAWAQSQMWGEGLFFPGYPYLAELAQRPEYRNIVETIAEEMTRKPARSCTEGREARYGKVQFRFRGSVFQIAAVYDAFTSI